MFHTYENATPLERYQMLADRDFCLLRYRYLLEGMRGDRIQEIRNFSGYLENETDFLRAPASSKKRFHLSEPGGLLRHSVLVRDLYIDLLAYHGVRMDPTSATLVSLFHDVSKGGIAGVREGDPVQPRYLRTSEAVRRRTGEEFTFNRGMTTLSLPAASLWIVSSFVPLSATEAQAILAHDGQYLYGNREYAHRLEPESLLLCQADEASLLYERELLHADLDDRPEE